MKVITEIIKNTYVLTFKSEATYEWSQIEKLFIESDHVYEDLTDKALINNNESKEDILYWQDLFFMEAAEQKEHLDIGDPLIKKLITHPLFISNQKFINHLPRATILLGRELLIDQLIDNKNADQLIPDRMIEAAFKKKSRDELRKNFKEWAADNEYEKTGDTLQEAGNKTSKSSSEFEIDRIGSGKFSYIKYLVAVCFIGVMAVIGFNNYNSGYNFEDSQYVSTMDKTIQRNTGLGFAGNKDSNSITVQIFDFNKAIVSNKSVSDRLALHSYLFSDKELKLVLEDSNVKTEVVELKQSVFYLKLNKEFFKIETSDDFKNLEKLNDQKIIEQLDRILFENE
jgi:hypothetical protein